MPGSWRPLLVAALSVLLVCLWPPRLQHAQTVTAQAGAGADSPRWVRIPAGTFEMGCVPGDGFCYRDETPRHPIGISRAFELMDAEVTVGQFRAMAGRGGPSLPGQAPWSSDDRPVIHVTWEEAGAFCAVLGGRLPTEAEWEFSARGGRQASIYPWGNEPPVCTPGAANGAQFEGCGAGTAPVRSFAPNGYGLYDMAGNVWEWVADWYDEDYYRRSPGIDPRGPDSGTVRPTYGTASAPPARAARGGAWLGDPNELRTSFRSDDSAPDIRYAGLGFRCARTIEVLERP